MATKPNNAMTVKAHGAWGVISTNAEGQKVYGAKVWTPQVVREGDIVSLQNWKGTYFHYEGCRQVPQDSGA